MSLNQLAFLNKVDVPTSDKWQNEINKLGYNFTIDPSLIPFSDSGFLPCKFDGKDTGFEIYYEGASKSLELYPNIKNLLGKRDYLITFRWSGDFRECSSVLIASLALHTGFDAIIYYPEDDLVCDRNYLIEQIEQCNKKF